MILGADLLNSLAILAAQPAPSEKSTGFSLEQIVGLLIMLLLFLLPILGGKKKKQGSEQEPVEELIDAREWDEEAYIRELQKPKSKPSQVYPPPLVKDILESEIASHLKKRSKKGLYKGLSLKKAVIAKELLDKRSF